MHLRAFSAAIVVLAALLANAGTTRYVDINNANPIPPYTSWATAATVIQDAIDAGGPGDEILVANGTYAAGGRAVYGTMTNRVAVYQPMEVRSVNGPSVTSIKGLAGPASAAIRCVYLANGALLSGFTLTGGGTRMTGDWFNEQSCGGVLCESVSAVVSNCTITGNIARGAGAGAYSGTLNNCTINGNFANTGGGGGASSSTLNNCTVSGNSAASGGGVQYGTLNNCSITGNSAGNYGGGTYSCLLSNCAVLNNHGPLSGGGAYSSDMLNCIVSGNTSADSGGGVTGGNLKNCLVASNSSRFGGGAAYGDLLNCTVTGNTAHDSAQVGGGGYGGGTYYGTVVNSIVYDNQGLFDGFNWSSSVISNSCTLPLPSGNGNISDDPMFSNPTNANYHLQANSPCINAGNSAAVATAVDLDGAPRVVDGVVDMGAYEHASANIPQPLLTALRPGSNGFSFTFQSLTGLLYVTEYKTALAPGPWTELERRFGQGAVESVTDTNAGGAMRLYRVRVQ